MIDNKETDDTDSAREIGRMISDFRKECINRVRTEIEDEANKIASEGFDPAKGRGRGPFWAEGG